jgi:hypothetical protein
MDAMRLRTTMLVVASSSLVLLAVAACTTDYQQGKGDPAFGGPNALAGQRPPGVSSEVASEAGGGGTDTPGAKPACVAAGGTLVDAGACSVSFSKQILDSFGLANCGTTNCHGGATPRNEPGIDPGDPGATWQHLQAFTISTGKPYINPCSTDDTASSMGCNMIAEGQAGACGVHMPSGAQLPADAITNINTWLKCGSPNN